MNELKTFLVKEQTRFFEDYCDFKLVKTVNSNELKNHQAWLREHDMLLVNKVLEIMKKELDATFNYPCSCDRENIKCVHQWDKSFRICRKLLNNLTI